MNFTKKIQKEAVLLIQQGMNAEMVHTVLNSLTDIPLIQDKDPELAEEIKRRME
jgi:hypothetical protein